MTNEAFDETTERHYRPVQGLWMDEWENNPLVWQEPMAETPYGWTLIQEYDRLYRQTETKTLVDVVMERPQFQNATSQFRMYLEAMVIDRKSTRLNSSHVAISYAVFCLKKKNNLLEQ